jgi:hypothetical protein
MSRDVANHFDHMELTGAFEGRAAGGAASVRNVEID